MAHKYVRHATIGFIIWPETDALWHSHIGRLLDQRREGNILSAGFVEFGPEGTLTCFGESESLCIASRPDDSAALAAQLGLKQSPKPA